MTAPVLERPDTFAAGSPTAPVPAAVPLGWTERIVATVLTFLLAYNTPTVWINTVANDGLQNLDHHDLASGQMVPFLAAGLLFAFLNLRCDVSVIVRAALREPLLPVLVGLAMLSALWSPLPGISFREGLNLAVVAVLAYWIALRFTLTEYVGVLAAVFGVGTLLNFFFVAAMGENGSTDQGWDGILGHRNSLGASCGLAVLFLLVTARVHRRFRALAYGLVGANVALMLGSGSKTSVVVLIAMPSMLLVFTAFRARRTLYAAVAITMTVFAGVLALVAKGNLDTITDALDRDPGLSGRSDIWHWTIDLIQRRPVFGYGWQAVWYDWSTPGRYVWQHMGFTVPHAHNGLLEVMLQLGLVGGVLAAAILVRLVIRGARIVRYYRGAVGLLPLTYAGYVLLTSVTEPGIYGRGVTFLVFVVVCTAAARGRRDALPPEPVSLQASATSLRRRR